MSRPPAPRPLRAPAAIPPTHPGRRAWLRGAAAAAVLGLAGCAGAPPAPGTDVAAAAPAARPRLVVLLVVDGLPQRQLEALRPYYGPDGLARLLDRGAAYGAARYGHAFTVTAAGHAALATGAYPWRTGIVGNNWLEPATGTQVYNTGDERHGYIGHATRPLDGTSPRNLLVETVGDVLRAREPAAKVVGISGKDRGAILPAGRTGTAYMYQASSGQFASTTYYMAQHPAWVQAWNAARPADRWFGRRWEALRTPAGEAPGLADGQPWYAGRAGRLPMAFSGPDDLAPGPAFYEALLRSPVVDQLSLDFALAAVAGEGLGADAVPDLLAVSLSGHDYVNHAYSAESRLSNDHLLQLDAQLQDFFRALDARVGAGRWVAALSADHGFSHAPESPEGQALGGRRVQLGPVVARVNAQLAAEFGGATPLVAGSPASSLVVSRRLVAERGLDVATVAERARAALLREEGIAAAYTAAELASGSRGGAPLFDAMRRSWHPQRSGEVQYALRRGWVPVPAGSTHGSPWDEDARVPLLLWGPPWVRAGRVEAPVEPVDLAPTLARLLGLPPLSQADGRPLPLP